MASLAPHQMQVARLLGINEAVVDRIRAGITPKVYCQIDDNYKLH